MSKKYKILILDERTIGEEELTQKQDLNMKSVCSI